MSSAPIMRCIILSSIKFSTASSQWERELIMASQKA
jgi:hypothetical protein